MTTLTTPDTKNERPFPGFPSDFWVPVPPVFFDELLPIMGEAVLRVVLYAMRRTYGWQKLEDWIALDDFVRGREIEVRGQTARDYGCGLTRQGTINGLRKAVGDGYLTKRVSCKSCGNTVADRETVTSSMGGPGKRKLKAREVLPKNCPSCGATFRGSSSNIRCLYRLRLVNDVDQNQSTTLTRTSQPSRLELVNYVDPQQTTDTKHNNSAVVDLLRETGLDQKTARKLAKQHDPARVAAVVAAAGERASTNRAGWIVKALAEGWDLGESEAAKRRAEQAADNAAALATLAQMEAR